MNNIYIIFLLNRITIYDIKQVLQLCRIFSCYIEYLEPLISEPNCNYVPYSVDLSLRNFPHLDRRGKTRIPKEELALHCILDHTQSVVLHCKWKCWLCVALHCGRISFAHVFW